MFQKLSYLNIIFSVIYVLVYLKNGLLNSTIGIFMVIVFNWLALRGNQLENFRWNIWHFITGLWSLCYVGYIMYGLINIFISAFEYEFVSDDTRTFLVLSSVFSIAVILHFGVYFWKNLKENKLIV